MEKIGDGIKNQIFNSWIFSNIIRYESDALLRCPPTINLETTNFCNAKCIMCPHAKMTRKKGIMDFDLFRKIMDDLNDMPVRTLSLSLIGEPLMDPLLLKRIHYINNENPKLGCLRFVTNGSLLHDEIADGILKSGLDEIMISFNGYSESYEKVMGIKFEKSFKNIINFCKKKKDMKLTKPYIRVNVCCLEENRFELEILKEEFKDMADSVTLTGTCNWAGDKNDIKGTKKCNTNSNFPCRLLWTDINILWNGDVVPCCRDWNGKIILGNLRAQNITDIWKGKKLIALRKLHLFKNRNKILLCKNCDSNDVGYWIKLIPGSMKHRFLVSTDNEKPLSESAFLWEKIKYR